MLRHPFALLTLTLALAAVPTPSRAEQAAAAAAATQPGDLGSPKKSLKALDRVGTDGAVDRAKVFYHATNDGERKVAKAFAGVDAAAAKLRKVVVARFDHAAGDAVMHALRDVTADDIDAATEEIEGDKATLSGKNFGQPLSMIKVDGAWKIDLHTSLTKSNADADQLVDVCEDLVDVVDRTAAEMQTNKYPNRSLLDRALKRRVKAILGGE